MDVNFDIQLNVEDLAAAGREVKRGADPTGYPQPTPSYIHRRAVRIHGSSLPTILTHQMTLTDLVTRIDQIIELGDQTLATRYTSGRSGLSVTHVKPAPMAGFRAAALSFIDRVYGEDHSHFKQFTDNTGRSFASDAERGLAILQPIRSEISGGWLFTIKGMVAAELFSDFLDMAEHLLEQGFKDAAAVMIGSVLEEHLRQLCHRHSVDLADERDDGRLVPRKADRLNADLAKKSVYISIDQKQITAWLGLRNDAAHGKYDQYTAEQVKQLLSGMIGFMARVTP